MCDVALDPYTSHGHDGLMRGGEIVNDATVAVLVRQALVQAEAGCDVIAPSDMMDGRIGAIRAALEAKGSTTSRSWPTRPNMPRPSTVRSATPSAPPSTAQGRQAHLSDGPRQRRRSAARGRRSTSPKAPTWSWSSRACPISTSLCRRQGRTFSMPTFAYQVSGEYAMLMAAGESGWLDPTRSMLGEPAGVQAGRGRRHPHLFRPRHGADPQGLSARRNYLAHSVTLACAERHTHPCPEPPAATGSVGAGA